MNALADTAVTHETEVRRILTATARESCVRWDREVRRLGEALLHAQGQHLRALRRLDALEGRKDGGV